MATEQKAEIKGEVGQALFEFLHMEMVSYLISSREKEDQVSDTMDLHVNAIKKIIMIINSKG